MSDSVGTVYASSSVVYWCADIKYHDIFNPLTAGVAYIRFFHLIITTFSTVF